ncbi:MULTISPECIES: replication initiation negative regulator SeqA [Corallincola]|uniref:Negative modulator of initiation of replication n=3 Tax=Corallincola TaxID=1775176 RepID=A0A368NLD0_9GAMM|nr:replication initiation negative regulator SeqA [Corallincola holothuriorum]RCU50595.1 replication initiation negative regulator SeqA [Corallincola holothuriorum]TAA48758.1 replication initiation negative regulator SeqA [Corallincola spongiicola]TCI01902.1 replication initiation negative regulator SeqA [Corallincola luteus]
MKTIEVDEDLYQFIASKTERIGESASDILRRLVAMDEEAAKPVEETSVGAPKEVVPTTSDFSIDSRQLASQKGAVGRFVYLLSLLHKYAPKQFSSVLEIKGRNRIYFATSQSELMAAGSSTAPRQIPDSPYWVITNTNTGKKRAMLKRVAGMLALNETQTELLLKSLPVVAGKKSKR